MTAWFMWIILIRQRLIRLSGSSVVLRLDYRHREAALAAVAIYIYGLLRRLMAPRNDEHSIKPQH